MANTIDKQTIVDSERNLVVLVNITGDNSGDEAATQLIDASSYVGSPARLRLVRVQSALEGFSAQLLWDATTDDELVHLPPYEVDFDMSRFGGIPDPGSTGTTGDVMITTTGLGSEKGTIILEFAK